LGSSASGGCAENLTKNQMKKILLKNARVVSSNGIDEKDVVLSGGKILKVCESGEGEDLLANIVDEKSEITKASSREEGVGEQSFGAEEGGDFVIMDCSAEGIYVMPGLIDAHVHFREPGLIEKGDFASESRAALAGGITTIFDMPNTVPPTTTYNDFKDKVKIAEKKCLCNFKLFVGGDDVAEIKKIVNDKKLGKFLAGVKVYMGCSTGGCGGSAVLEKILAEESLAEVPVVVHAEDQACLDKYAGKFDANKPSSHGDARPVECAVEGIKVACHLAKKYDRPIHIAHVTSVAEIEVIQKFDNVTFEVSPRHLFLNDSMYSYGNMGHLLKVNPPVRSREIVRELWSALYDGQVDIIASDHSPHTLSEKGFAGGGGVKSAEGAKSCAEDLAGENGSASCVDAAFPSGMPEVQTMLPLLLNEVSSGKFGLKDIVRMCCEKPSEIFGLSKAGRIADGYKADIVIVDLGQQREVSGAGGEKMLYKCGWTPYKGRTLKGWPKKVILGGEII